MKSLALLLFFAFLSLCAGNSLLYLLLCLVILNLAGLPKVLVVQEALENGVTKYLSEWADLQYSKLDSLANNLGISLFLFLSSSFA